MMLQTWMRPLLFLALCFVLGCCKDDVNVTNEISSSNPLTTENGNDTSTRSSTLDSSTVTSTIIGTALNSTVSSSTKTDHFSEFNYERSLLDILSKTRNSLSGFLSQTLDLNPHIILPGFSPQMLDLDPQEIFSNLLPQLKLPGFVSPSRCMFHLIHALQAAIAGEPWALKLLDSWGRPHSFLRITALRIPGNYDQCISTISPSKEVTGPARYRGNYCVVTVAPTTPINELTNKLYLGTCMPNTCSEGEITRLLTIGLGIFNLSAGLQILQTDCGTEHREITTATVVAIVLLCIIGLLTLTGTVVDIVFVNRPKWFELFYTRADGQKDSEKHEVSQQCHQTETDEKNVNNKQDSYGKNYEISASNETLRNHEGEKESLIRRKSYKNFLQADVGKMLLAFSIYSNGKSILKTNPKADALTSLYGIRVITVWWLVLSYLLMYGFANRYNDMSNLGRFLRRQFNFAFNGSFAIDTFFSISGLLTSYLLSKKMEKKGWKIKWHKVFFHRYWRFTPPYMLVLVTVVGLSKFMGSGPMWTSYEPLYIRNCDKYWWTNLLYINNFIDPAGECGSHFWYLAVEMQFFLLAPLMLIPFCINMYAGLGSCLIFLLIDWITAGVLSVEKNWVANIFQSVVQLFLDPREASTTASKIKFYRQYYYVFPFTRIGPYVIGILAGKFLAVTNSQFKIKWYVATLCWIVAFATGLAIIYGPYDNSEDRSMAALYNAVSRTAWGASVCWVVVACALGYGGPVTALLSWSPFVVLSRLIYMTYLIHVVVVDVSYRNMDRLTYLTKTSLVEMYMGINVTTGLLAFVLALCFELPFANLKKIILSK